MASTPILYDGACGFCRWMLSGVLRWDVHDRLRPVALQAPEADRLLGDMPEERRMASWHLVLPDGSVASGGAAFAPVFARLPGGRPLSALAAALPGPMDVGYRFVAGRRDRLGPLIPAALKAAATRRIAERT